MYVSWWYPFVLVIALALFPFVLIYIHGYSGPIASSTWFDQGPIYLMGLLVFFVIFGIKYIIRSSKKKIAIGVVVVGLGLLVALFNFLLHFYWMSYYETNKKYITTEFKSTCLDAKDPRDMVVQMNALLERINEQKISSKSWGEWGRTRIGVISPTSELLQSNGVPFLYFNITNSKIPLACFWDKVANKPKYLASTDEKTFGRGSNGFRPKIKESAILTALDRKQSPVQIKKPSNKDFIRQRKEDFIEYLKALAPKGFSDEELKDLLDGMKLVDCAISDIEYDKQFEVYQAMSKCSVQNDKGEKSPFDGNVYLTFSDGKWVGLDKDTRSCMVVKKEDTKSGWLKYKRLFPQGRCIAMADERIKQLTPLVSSFTNDSKSFEEAHVSSDGQLIAINSDKKIYIYDPNKDQVLLSIPVETNSYHLSFSDDNTQLFAAFMEELKLYDVKSGKELALSKNLPMRYGVFSEELLLFAYSARDKKDNGFMIELYDPKNGKKVKAKKINDETYKEVKKLGISSDGRYVLLFLEKVYNKGEDEVLLWDTKAWKILWKRPASRVYRKNCGFSPDGKMVAYVDKEKDALLFLDSATGKEIAQYSLKGYGYFDRFAMNNDGNKIVLMDGNDLALVDIKNNKRVQSMRIDVDTNNDRFAKKNVWFTNKGDKFISFCPQRLDVWQEVSK